VFACVVINMTRGRVKCFGVERCFALSSSACRCGVKVRGGNSARIEGTAYERVICERASLVKQTIGFKIKRSSSFRLQAGALSQNLSG